MDQIFTTPKKIGPPDQGQPTHFVNLFENGNTLTRGGHSSG
jgi:hypothetical protein